MLVLIEAFKTQAVSLQEKKKFKNQKKIHTHSNTQKNTYL